MNPLITKQDVIEKLLILKDEMPDAVNPIGEFDNSPSCLYTSQLGDKHCIAGQLLKMFDLPVPDASVSTGFIALEQRKSFTEKAGTLIGNLQSAADGYRVDIWDLPAQSLAYEAIMPRPWGEVIDVALEHVNASQSV